MASKYFETKNLDWYEICNKIYSKIESNINKINDINLMINDIFKESINKKMDSYTKSLERQKVFSKINLELQSIEKSKLSRSEKILTYEQKVREILDKLKNNSWIQINNKLILKIENKLLKFKKINKFLLLFKTKNTIKRNINKINYLFEKMFHQENKEILDYFSKVNKIIDVIKKLFTNHEIIEYGFNKIKKFDINMNEVELLNLISSFDIIRINFNIIQQKLDITYRSENVYLYRHICEWLYIENNFKNIKEIKPIISSNLQGINLDKINKLWNTNINEFDYMMIDEAGQVNSKFIPYISLIAKQIIVVGDITQLSSIQDKNINENYKLLKNYFDKKEFDELINLLSNSFDIMEYKNKIKYKYISLLDWINKKSNIISITKNEKTNDGLFLLEHFRCPYQIFSLINKYFYDKNLIFINHIDETHCSFSSLISNEITCNETSLIQIKYTHNNEYGDENKNMQEIEIGINFIIDNIKNMIIHNDPSWDGIITKKEYNYLIKNVAFVTLYKNQKNIIEKVINNIEYNLMTLVDHEENFIYQYDFVENIILKIKNNFQKREINFIKQFFKNFKNGTVDAVQGIGCDFVIFSNVSDKYVNKNEEIKWFEFSENRINVLWTRTKKHFIHIVSNQYWKNISKEQIKGLEFRFESEVNSEKLNLSRVIFNLESNNNLSIQNLVSKFQDFDCIKMQINEIGKYGEKVFNSILKDNYFSELLTLKIIRELGIEITFLDNTKWVNYKNESFLNYDFITSDKYYIDVKSTRKIRNNEILISKNEYKFGKDNSDKYIIAKINNITKYNLNLNNLASKAFVLNNISFYKYEGKILRNKNKSIYYIFREDL